MDPVYYLNALIALVLVVGLVMLAGWAARRFGIGPIAGAGRRRRAGRRLAIVEAMALDSRRRLVLVRRDETEHLLLLGPGDDRVVETGITPPHDALPAPDGTPAPAASNRPEDRQQ